MDINKNEFGKIPPQSIEAEDSLIGSLINNPEAYFDICNIVKTESFYKDSSKCIFDAISILAKNNEPIDLVTVTTKLKSLKKLDTIGGAFHLTELSSKYSFSYNYEHHAKIIQQKYIQRELIRIGYEIMNTAYDDTVDLIEHLSFAQNSIENIDKFTIDEGLNTLELATKTIEEIEIECEDVKKGKVAGVPCGLTELNSALGGFKKRSFIILGARPGEGKTTHALNFAVSAAKAGFWVNFYSYEMGSSDLFKIMIAGVSGVNRSKIRDGRVEENDWNLINATLEEINTLPILWYDDPDISISQIKSNTRKNKLKDKCDMVIVDYLQLMPVEEKNMNREWQISDISRKAKRIAKSMDIPVIALAQLNRDVERRSTPEVYNSDLRESGSLEQDADVIIFLYSEKDENGVAYQRFMKISKHRNGKTGIFKYSTNAEMTKIFDAENDYVGYEQIDEEYIDINKNIEPMDNPF